MNLMNKWNYGDAYKRHPIKDVHKFADGSIIKVHDIFDKLPDFMMDADMILSDPPWNITNLSTFYAKAEKEKKTQYFSTFYKRFFECISEIDPHSAYVFIGKQYLADFITEMKRIFRYVIFFNSFYYDDPKKLCYCVVGSKNGKKKKLDNMSEGDIIDWVCENENYNIIGDLCIGRGYVGIQAQKNNKRFVGTELNNKRLSVLIEALEGDKK